MSSTIEYNTKIYHRVYHQKLYHRKIYEIKSNTEKKVNSLTLENPAIPKVYTCFKACNKRNTRTSSGNSINSHTNNL